MKITERSVIHDDIGLFFYFEYFTYAFKDPSDGTEIFFDVRSQNVVVYTKGKSAFCYERIG